MFKMLEQIGFTRVHNQDFDKIKQKQLGIYSYHVNYDECRTSLASSIGRCILSGQVFCNLVSISGRPTDVQYQGTKKFNFPACPSGKL